jgi:hypothetical protein
MNLGSILGVVAGVALMATGSGAGIAAGAFLAAGSLAAGLAGGSIGKFMNSGLMKGLMGAVVLGSAAYAVYGATPTQAGTTEAAQTGQAATAAAPLGAAGSNIISSGDDAQAAALTHTSISEAAGMGPEISSIQSTDPSLAGPLAPSLTAMNAQTIAGPGAQGSQASAAATAADTAAPQAGRGLTGAAGAGPGAAAPAPPAPTSASPPSDVTPPAAAPAAGGGFMSKAAGLLDTKGGAAAITGVGSMLGGIGSGIAQKQATEDALRAAQWGNVQWQNQGQVDKMQAAAAAPITVPQGYLQRAQQIRALMQGNAGMQPLPTAQPGAPLAPSPLPPPGH